MNLAIQGPAATDVAPEDERKVLTIEDAVAALKIVLKLPHERDYYTLLLWAGQSYVLKLLTTVFYVGFHGPTGSGKTTGVESCVAISKDGQVLGSCTESYLRDELHDGKTVGITEVDRLITRSEAIATLLRNGYRPGAEYGFKVPSGEKSWERVRRSVFGPKVFDFNTSIDGHIQNRSILIEMQRDASVDRVLDAEDKVVHLAPVKAWLTADAEKAMQQWAPERAQALRKNQAFREKLKELRAEFPRDIGIAATMMTVAKVFGWNIVNTIFEIVKNRSVVEEYGEEMEVAEAILALTTRMGDEELQTDKVLGRLNDHRRTLGLRSMSPQQFAANLKVLGFRKGETWYKATTKPFRNQSVIRPYPILESLARLAQPERPTQAASDVADAPNAPNAPVPTAPHGSPSASVIGGTEQAADVSTPARA